MALLSATSAQSGDFPFGITELDNQLISIVPRDAIPAMTNPVPVTAQQATFVAGGDIGSTAYVADDDRVLGVVLDGQARAYPINLGWWHEVINDRLGGRPISVTYCPLTGTGLVFDAAGPDGAQFELGVSGLLLNSNLVLYDRRDDRTLYPQMTHRGLTGQFRDERLRLLPVIETTWRRWKQMYPGTDVPLYGTGLDSYSQRRQRVYTDSPERYYESLSGYPYGSYRDNDRLLFPVTTSEPDLSVYGLKEVVLGLCVGEQTVAYPLRDLPDGAVVNDRVDTLDVVVLFDAASQTAIPYSRQVEGRALTFQAVEDEPVVMVDLETGSGWSMAGQALRGPLQGRRLAGVPAYTSMWFAWNVFWPAARIWDGRGIVRATAVTESNPSAPAVSRIRLEPNTPNPFNATTQFRYELAAEGEARLTLFDMAGQPIRHLLTGWRAAGAGSIVWDGRDDDGRRVASGVYVARLATTEFATHRRVLLLR